MHVVIAGNYPANLNKISGGVEAVVRNLSQALQTYPDLNVEVITISQRGSQPRTVTHGEVTVHYLPASNRPSYFSIMAGIQQMKAKILQLKPDIVHAQVAGEYAEAAALSGLPWLLTLHGIRYLEVDLWQGFLNKHYRGWFIKREERRALKRANQIISISPYIRSVLNGQIQAPIADIENPVDDEFFQVPSLSTHNQLLFVGRLIPRKGIDVLLRAFAQLHQQRPDLKLRIAGGQDFSNELQDYPAQLKQYVHDNGLSEAVTFLGEIDQPALLTELANCSLFVLAALQETAPMVIMEAMAAGRPVVSTDAGGSRYLVENDQAGFIVPPNNVDALAEALGKAVAHPEKLDAMGRRAKEIAIARFHAKQVAERTRALYYKQLGLLPPASAVNAT